MEFFPVVLSLIYIIGILWLIGRVPLLKVNGIPNWLLRIGFAIKLVACGAFMYVYTSVSPYNRQNDMVEFESDAHAIYSVAFEQPKLFASVMLNINTKNDTYFAFTHDLHKWYKPWHNEQYNNNRNFIRILVLLEFLAFGQQLPLALLCCFLSFVGCICLVKALSALRKQFFPDTLLPLLLLPSVLFWTSGILKDSIALFAIGVLTYSLSMIRGKGKIRIGALFVSVLAALLLLSIRSYLLGIYAIVAIAFLWGQRAGKGGFALPLWSKYVLTCFGVGLLVVAVGCLSERCNLLDYVWTQNNSMIMAQTAFPQQGYFDIPFLQGHWWEIIIYTPLALYNTLLRPTLLEAHNVMQYGLAIENILLLVLAIWAGWHMDFGNLQNNNLFYALTLFGLILFVLIGLTVPNYGALNRYRLFGYIALFLAILSARKYPVIKIK